MPLAATVALRLLGALCLLGRNVDVEAALAVRPTEQLCLVLVGQQTVVSVIQLVVGFYLKAFKT